MTPEKQRIAIEAARGHIWTQADDGFWDGPGDEKPGMSLDTLLTIIPNYLNDLNAMHGAVVSQDDGFQVDFATRAGALSKWTHQLTAKDWADCFIATLQSKREGGR